MKFEKVSRDIVCDMGGCREKAEYAFWRENAAKFEALNICERCLKELQGEVKKLNVKEIKKLIEKEIKNER